jgi:hypothetical protein
VREMRGWMFGGSFFQCGLLTCIYVQKLKQNSAAVVAGAAAGAGAGTGGEAGGGIAARALGRGRRRTTGEGCVCVSCG